jgi:hypothetical protein
MSATANDLTTIFHGTIIGKFADRYLLRLFPGLTLDVRADDIEVLEEREDQVTRRSYVRVKLRSDADVSANFQPHVARLALAAETDVPFAFGGIGGVNGLHSMPGGGARPIIPWLDANALRVFADRLGPDAWGLLAQQAGLGSNTYKKATTNNTTTQSNTVTSTETTGYDTPGTNPLDGSVTHTADTGADPLNEVVNDDTSPDTSSDTY